MNVTDNLPMQNFVNSLSGLKTYITVAAGGVLLFGTWNKWWVIDPSVYTALMLAAVAFLRAGVAKGSDTTPPTTPKV